MGRSKGGEGRVGVEEEEEGGQNGCGDDLHDSGGRLANVLCRGEQFGLGGSLSFHLAILYSSPRPELSALAHRTSQRSAI